MKKIFAILAVLGLAACATGQKPLRSGSTPDKDNAVYVFKLDLTPAINEDFEKASEKDDEFVSYSMLVVSADSPKKLDEDYREDQTYWNLETQKFVAIEVPAGKPLEIRQIGTASNHRAFWLSNTDHFYYTTLENPAYEIVDTPKAGRAYYLGTMKIDLADKSFSYDEDDDEYDYDEWHFIVPKGITIVDEISDAQKWFDQNYKKIDEKLQKVDLKMKDTGKDNTFNHTAITTTSR